MVRHSGQRVGFWPAVVVIGLAAAGGYAAFLLVQPACGAPGNTSLGRSNRYVPWALLAVEMISVIAVGKLTRRRTPTIISGVVLASVLAAVAAVIVFVFWFGSGDCGE